MRRGGRGGPGFHEAGGKYGGTFGAKRTVLIDYLGLPVAARVDSARPHDSKTGRMLLDHSLPSLPRVGEVLADLGFEPLVKGIQRRHKVTVTTKGCRKANKPKGFKPIRPLWKVEDCFAQLGRWRRGVDLGSTEVATRVMPARSRRPNAIGGVAAGLLGGLVASWVMNTATKIAHVIVVTLCR